MVKNNPTRRAPCLAGTLTETREQHTGKMIKEDVGEIISDREGGIISWKTSDLRRDPNERMVCCWKSGGRPSADLRK